MGELKFSTLDDATVLAAKNKLRTPIRICPDSIVHDISGVTTGWSDFVVVSGNLIALSPSSDEDHANTDGYVFIINMSTWTVTASYRHNLGHCNTMHYDSGTDVLMIGNLPGATGLLEAIYLIYDFSTLLTANIVWDSIDKTIVDLSGQGTAYFAVASCFGEHNDGVRDLVYVNGNYNVNWIKIQLGMGTNNLGSGTYNASDADKYNGSYKVIWETTYLSSGDTNEEVIQGIDYYKGRIYTSNGHTGMKGAIWSFNEDLYVIKDVIYNAIYTGAGVEKTVDSEGLTIASGKCYIGIEGEGYMSICEFEL